jgi:hypothetical protein
MRDHLAALIPDWQEQNPSDIGNALVDLLAYAGDYLQLLPGCRGDLKRICTACRRGFRSSHTRLLDYHLHEGCNARALVR